MTLIATFAQPSLPHKTTTIKVDLLLGCSSCWIDLKVAMPITGNYLLLLLGGLLPLFLLLLPPVDAKPLLFTLTWPPAHARQYTGIGWYRRLGVTPIQRVNLLPFSREAVQGRNPHSNISTSSMDQPPWLLSHWLPGSYTLPTPVRPGRQAMTRDDPRFDGENSGAVARGEPLPADMVRRFHERNAAGRWLAPSIIRRLRDRSQMEALRRAYQSIWDAVIPFTPIYHPVESTSTRAAPSTSRWPGLPGGAAPQRGGHRPHR